MSDDLKLSAQQIAVAATPAVRRRNRLRASAPDLGEVVLSDTEPVEGQIYRLARRAAMAGALQPGTRVTSRSLAEALGVSPTPVRIALKRLEADGVLEARLKSAFVVTEMTQRDYGELLAIRVRLEGLAAREAARRITPAGVRRLVDLNRAFAAGGSRPQVLDANYRFHFEIYRAAGMPHLLEMIERLWLRIGPQLYHAVGASDLDRAVINHDSLIAALRAGDGAAADEALGRDLTDAAEAVVPVLPPRG